MQLTFVVFARVFYQAFQELDERCGIERFAIIIQCALPWLLTLAIMLSLWRVPPPVKTSGGHGRIAASIHIGFDHSSLIKPMYFRLFGCGLFRNP